MIDLIGYRRYGHNEGDEPTFTQPLMYKKIKNHSTVCQRWADTLTEREVIETDWPQQLVNEGLEQLQNELDSLEPEEDLGEEQPEAPPPGAARETKTALPLDKLRKLHEALLQIPDDFNLHSKIKRGIKRVSKAMDDPNKAMIDWATAEKLALASILADGIAIRLTGQDVERGTFSQRHAVFFDTESDRPFIPLQSLRQAKVAFEIHNSPLSENAAIGFEFGYNVQAPDRLVIWEAQYGDFINNAQVMLDEFITSARAKWGQTPSLVLLLPHGHEGQGPDHSTGRLERFLQLAAETNIRVANCTTAAQYFHLLRRQAALLKTDPLPLVVMTPKSLLRHPRVASPPKDLSEGGWQPVIDDVWTQKQSKEVQRLILCSGKVYVDMVTADRREETPEIALARVEQLYPFPASALKPVLESYAKLEEIVWVQEEPQNMGAWPFFRNRLTKLIDGRWPLIYLGRPQSSSPAEGSSAWHAVTQKVLVEQAYNLAEKDIDDTILWEKS